jgi:hypothetical protein
MTQKNINKIMSLLLFGKRLYEKTSHLLPGSIPECHLLARPVTFPTEGLNEQE